MLNKECPRAPFELGIAWVCINSKFSARIFVVKAAFRAELKAHAKNPRALFGLAECLRAQKKTAEAAAVSKEFEAGWKNADVKLKMSDL